MKKRALLKHGNIFYLKIGNQDKYIFGRVLFDVKRQYHKIRDTNNLPKSIHSLTYLMDSYSDCQLIEVFEGIYNRIEDFNSSHFYKKYRWELEFIRVWKSWKFNSRLYSFRIP